MRGKSSIRLIAIAGACVFLVADQAGASGFLRKGATSSVVSYGYGVAPMSAVPVASFGAVPLSTGYFASSYSAAPAYTTYYAAPATSFASFSASPFLVSHPVAPNQFSSLSTLASLSALSAGAGGTPFGTLLAGGTSPFAAAEIQATAQYPAFAAIANAQGLPASLFVDFLKRALGNIIGGSGGGGGGGGGGAGGDAGLRNTLRNVLFGLLQGFLNTPGLGFDIEKIIGELLGTGGTGGTGTGGDRCITIRVCCDGGGGATVSGPAGGGDSLGKLEDLTSKLGGLINQAASPQQAAGPHGAQLDPSQTPPSIPPVPTGESPFEAPEVPNREEARHEEIKTQLEGINAALQAIAAKLPESK